MFEAAKNGDKFGCVGQTALYRLLGDVPDGSIALHELIAEKYLYILQRGATRSVGVTSRSPYYDRGVAALMASNKT